MGMGHGKPCPRGGAGLTRRVPRGAGDERRRGRRAGLSLLEVTIGFTVLVVSLTAFVRVIASSNQATTTTHEGTLAKEAARMMLETVQAAPFDEAFALYNDDPEDDPDGVGSAPGAGFAVDGLAPRAGDEDGLAGSVRFPTLDGAPGVLREDLIMPAVGLPRDLNGDGQIDGADRSGDYELLPVIVRVEWVGSSGDSQLEFKTLIGGL